MDSVPVGFEHSMVLENQTGQDPKNSFDQATGADGGTIFMVGEGLSLVCAVVYFKYLPAGITNSNTRHVMATLMGLGIGFFCFGSEYLLVVLQAVLCYLGILLLPHNVLQTGILVFSLLYLNIYLIYRQLDIQDTRVFRIDVSGTLMIATEKVTSLAFGIVDGRKTEPMSKLRKRFVLKRVPSPMEYFSYMLCFQGLIAGPLIFYNDYIAYIQGTNIEKTEEQNGNLKKKEERKEHLVPSLYKSVLQKLIIAGFWIALHTAFQAHFPKEKNIDPEFVRTHSIQYKMWYMVISFVGVRAKFYLAFILGDAICNAAGLGFSGYDANGQPKWDLVTNIKPLGVEFGLNPKTMIDNWNIQTSYWLRHICYDRVTTYKKQKTFLLSAVWHGCYPGYWISLVPCAFFIGTFNLMRKKIRPYFLGSRGVKLFYDILTCCLSQIVVCYLMMPFVLLEFKPSIDFYKSLNWCVHIISIILTVVVPFLPTPVTDEHSDIVTEQEILTQEKSSSDNMEQNSSSYSQIRNGSSDLTLRKRSSENRSSENASSENASSQNESSKNGSTNMTN